MLRSAFFCRFCNFFLHFPGWSLNEMCKRNHCSGIVHSHQKIVLHSVSCEEQWVFWAQSSFLAHNKRELFRLTSCLDNQSSQSFVENSQ